MKDFKELNKTNTPLEHGSSASKAKTPDPAFDPNKFSGAMTNPFCPFFPDMAALFGKINKD